MKRLAVVIVLVLGIGAAVYFGGGGGGAEPVELAFVMLPEGTTHLEMWDSPPRRSWQYQMTVRSRAKETVSLQVRFEPPEPAGMQVLLVGDKRLLRESSGNLKLIFAAPREFGKFAGTVTIFSEDLPDWSQSYTFEGEVVNKALVGAYLRARQVGLALGEMAPGERRKLVIVLENPGNEPTTIAGWSSRDPVRVLVPRFPGEMTLEPGSERTVACELIAPREAGEFRAAVRFEADAVNLLHGLLDVRVSCKVVPDYAATPGKQRLTAYPMQRLRFKCTVRGREGTKPFTVDAIAGHEEFFEVESTGTKEPASEQVVAFRLRRDAPTDPARFQEFTVLLRLAPVGAEVVWPVRARLLPVIWATPPRKDFGKLLFGQDIPERLRQIRIASFGGRKFKVTGARAAKGHFNVRLDQRPGLAPSIYLTLPKGKRPNPYSDTIVIETDDADVPAIHVPAFVEIVPR